MAKKHSAPTDVARRRKAFAAVLKATTAELEMVALVLREARHAKAETGQLQIVIDPWLCGDGANVTVMHSARGFATQIEGKFSSRRSARPARGERSRS